MRTEGIKRSARSALMLVAALIACRPVRAQHVLTNLPGVHEAGENPITFMRPHFIIQAEPGVNLPTPPSSAFSPLQIRHAYGFDQVANQGAGQVIGIVDAYDDPNVQADLTLFSKQFGLPACTTSNGCFREIFQGNKRPAANANWSVEIALDVEWAHAVAPQATILLVETSSNSFGNLLAGVDLAVGNGASVVSMSWIVGEFSGESGYDNHFASNGVTFVAASGDNGTGVAYPASSPYVVAVGGTTLILDSHGNYQSETAWTGSGGGLSSFEHEPLFQAQFRIPYDARGTRGVPDVAYNANPSTGFAVYDSFGINGSSGWLQVGGTSAGSPQWAALIAIANSLRAASRKAHLSGIHTPIYAIAKSAGSNFLGVNYGTNGNCGVMCSAGAGFDYVTGLGTPQSNVLISSLAAQK
jgi:subtilase family serine protease